MNSELEAYEQGAMPKPVQNYQVQLLQKLVFDNRLPLDSSPSTLPVPALASPDDSLWQFLSNLRQALRQSDQEENEQAKVMLDTLSEDQVRMGDCVIYYKHQSRLYLCNFIPDDDDPKLILDPFPDCESIRYNKDKDKLIRHNCSDAEEARLMSTVHTWAAANGWRIESCDPEDDA